MNPESKSKQSIKYHLSKYFRIKNTPSTINISKELASGNIQWHELYPSKTVQRKKPIQYGKNQVNFPSYPSTNFPAIGYAVIPKGIITCGNGWIQNTHKQIFSEASWYATFKDEIREKKSYHPLFPQTIKGSVLTLLSDFAFNNYGHVLLDSLSRFHILEKSELASNSFDWILLPGKKSQTLLDLAKDIGIDENKILWSSNYRFLKADEVVATSFPGLRRNYPQWLVNYLKKKLGQYNSKPSRKLYIQRTGTRKIENENEIIHILKKYGFEIYRPEESTNSRVDFCNASAVIGGHGAGLTDILFCNPQTPILELLPSAHTFEYYYTLADSADLNYSYLVCESREKREDNTFGPNFSDYFVDPLIFEDIILKHFKNIL